MKAPVESAPLVPEKTSIAAQAATAPTTKESNRPKSTFNMQNIGKAPVKAEEKKDEKSTATNHVDKPVELESLKKVWSEFAELRKNQLAEYQLLKRDFILKDNHVTIPLNNPIEEPLLQNLRTSLIAYLRDKLGNSSLLVTGKLEEIESKKTIYTNKEKFDHLASKNPALAEFQQRFGLDPDF